MLLRSKIIIYLLILGGIFIFPNFVLAADVVINEIAWMGTIENWRYEWLELYTDQPISLDGWKIELYRNDLDFTIELSGTIEDYFLIVASDNIFANYDFNYSNLSGKLNNSGQKIILRNNQGDVVDEIDCFSSGEGWLFGNNDTKQTMEKTGSTWQTSLNALGTPKAQNSTGEISDGETEEPAQEESDGTDWTPPTVVNNPPTAKAGTDITALVNQEISFDGSQSSDPDNDILTYFWNFGDGATDTEKECFHTYLYPGQYIVSLLINDGELSNLDVITVNVYEESIIVSEFNNEWIELYNQSNQVANLTNWQLDGQEQGSSTPFIFPLNSLIAPNQFLVLRQQITKLAFNDESDQIRLIYPDGSVAIEVSYDTEEKQGLSIAFNGSDYFWTKTPTPGSVNIISSTNLNNKNENISSNNPEPIIEEAQEIPETLTKTNLTQSKNLSVINPLTESDDCLDNLTDSCIIEQDLLSNKGNIAEQQVASLIKTTQSSQKSKLILYISIIISASLIISWGLIRLRH